MKKLPILKRRVLDFSLVFVFLLLVTNNMRRGDEYYMAYQIYAGAELLHSHHLVATVFEFIGWWVPGFLGFPVTAMRGCQISSAFFSAVGAAALIDLAMFFGFKRFEALLVCIPIILCNGFVRYGTSAYCDSMALGMGLLALNFFVKADSDGKWAAPHRSRILFSGMAAGLAGLLHVSFLTVLPGWVSRTLAYPKNKVLNFVLYTLGVLLVLVPPYFLFFFFQERLMGTNGLLRFDPQVGTRGFDLLLGKQSNGFQLNDWVIGMKTFMAVFAPGIHADQKWLDLMLNVPRLIGGGLFAWILAMGWKNRTRNKQAGKWYLPLALGSLLLTAFAAGWYPKCRQYMVVVLASLGPLFVVAAKNALEGVASHLRKGILVSLGLVCILHMVFGIEGLVELYHSDHLSTEALWNYKRLAENPNFLKPAPARFYLEK